MGILIKEKLINYNKSFLYRKDLDKLVEWFNSPFKKPLLVLGPRHVGKTFLVKNIFAENYFKDDYVYINFANQKSLIDRFKDKYDVQSIIKEIQINYSKTITENTLLIFDEIQLVPSLKTAMKDFNENYREKYNVICCANYLYNTSIEDGEGFPVGQVDVIYINTLTFEEFLINSNKHYLLDEIKNALENFVLDHKFVIKKQRHKDLIEEFEKFLIVGSFPEIVSLYLRTNNFNLIRNVKQNIYNSYLTDIYNYVSNENHYIKSKVSTIYSDIYKYIEKSNNVFKLTSINEHYRYNNLKTVFNLLLLTNLVFKINNVKNPKSIYDNLKESKFKLYYNDFGLCSLFHMIDNSIFNKNTKKSQNFKKFIGENFVFSELSKKVQVNDYIAYYKFRDESNNRYEINMLCEDSRYNIIPIQIIVSTTISKKSLNKYIKDNKPKYAITLSLNNFSSYEVDNGKHLTKVFNIPLYLVGFLKWDTNRLDQFVTLFEE